MAWVPASAGMTLVLARSHTRQGNELPRRGRLADRHLDQHRSLLLEGAAQGGPQLLRRGCAQTHGAEAFGHLDEVRVGQVAGDGAAAVVLLLDAPHVPVAVVVEDDGD